MEPIQKFGKLLTINIAVLVVLLVMLLFFIQKGGEKDIGSIEDLAQRALLEKNIREVYTEATKKPYYEDNPEELDIKEIKFANLEFEKEAFEAGEDIVFSFEVHNYMDPKVDENKYVFGMKILAEVTDPLGRKIDNMSIPIADIADYNAVKGLALTYDIGLEQDSDMETGTYTLKLIAFDKISETEGTKEGTFTIT